VGNMTAQRISIQNILVTTDFSSASVAALRYAGQWAARLGAKVHVAHFVRPIEYAVGAGYGYGVDEETLMEVGRREMTQLAAEAAREGLGCQTYLLYQELQEGLAGLIEEVGIDLVVLASAGRRGVSGWLLGSTADSIFRSVSCPVVMLGPEASPKALAGGRILYATDFGGAAVAASAMALGLAQAWRAELSLMHVLAPSGSGVSATPEVEAAEARLWALLPAEAADWRRTQAAVRFGRPAKEIVKLARSWGSGLIVLGARRAAGTPLYHGWETAYQVLCEAPCPVLTVRE